MANYIDKIKKDGVEYEIRTQGPLPITAELAHSDIGDEQSILPSENKTDLDEETILLYANELRKIATRGWIEFKNAGGIPHRYNVIHFCDDTEAIIIECGVQFTTHKIPSGGGNVTIYSNIKCELNFSAESYRFWYHG